MIKRIPQVKSVMTPFPYSVPLDAPIATAQEFMEEHAIRHLPVTDDHRLLGIVTDRDIKILLGPNAQHPTQRELSVRDVYIPDPYIVDLRERLDTVLLTMAERHIGSALVTKETKLAGVFTVTDACRCFAEYLREHFSPGGGNEAA